ncbi:MAG: glycosyltransferase, partial [Geodermatophilaceae bacterium]|nr:glycosyltransferase [Geodermatophilaceae bacterium]
MRRRVLHVTEAPGWGIYSLLVEFTREQTVRGDDVHILAPASMRRLADVSHHDWSVQRNKPQTFPGGLRDLRRTVAELRPDVVHLHSFFGGFFGRLPLLSGLRGTPTVYQPHAWAFNVVELAKAKTAIELWERSAGRRTDVMVANCIEEVDEGRQAGAAAAGIPLGIALDTDRFAPVDAEERARARAELGLGADGVLLCLGRQAKQKGQDQLVSAWESAPIGGAQLVLVGIDDPAELAALAPTQWDKTVRAVASVTDVRPWLHACDLLVMPSRYEGSAVTVPEALATG